MANPTKEVSQILFSGLDQKVSGPDRNERMTAIVQEVKKDPKITQFVHTALLREGEWKDFDQEMTNEIIGDLMKISCINNDLMKIGLDRIDIRTPRFKEMCYVDIAWLPKGLTNLRTLNCGGCRGDAGLPAGLTKLEVLNCSDCNITAELSASLSAFLAVVRLGSSSIRRCSQQLRRGRRSSAFALNHETFNNSTRRP